MPAAEPPVRTVRPRVWTKALVIETVLILSVPVILGAAVGFFEINPVEAELLTPVGFEAHLLLESFPDNALVVEIAYQRSAGPPPTSAVSTLLNRINETCSKGTVTVDEHAFDSSAPSFGEGDLLSTEESVRQHWPVPGEMSLFYLYLEGSYSSDPSVIGVAYRGSSIAIFEGTIARDASLFGATVAVTTTVMVHEFGHELGLVGIIGNAPNEDMTHPPHSDDPHDVMYWEVDTTGIGALGANPPTQFDAADLSDLATVRSTPIWTELVPWAVLASCVACAALLVHLDLRARTRAGTE